MVVDGVLIPNEMRDLPMPKLRRYAAKAKKTNAVAIDAYFKLDEAAVKLGYPSIEAFVDEYNAERAGQ